MIQVVQQWRTKTSSLKFKATDLKIHTAETIVAVEDVAEVLHEVHQRDVEVTMVTTATDNLKGTTNNKIAQNQHAGGATYMVTDKKIAGKESRPKHRARG